MTGSFDASALPLVLAGPLLRRVDPPTPTSAEETGETDSPSNDDSTSDGTDATSDATDSISDDTRPASVTVWIALSEARTVGLTVFEGEEPRLTSESVETVPLGEHLHVVAVTADQRVGEEGLAPGVVYGYDLEFTNGTTTESLDGVLEGGMDSITYGDETKPTFSLPPPDPGDLRLVHASCRKAHAPGEDALPAVHDMIRWTVDDANARPHQLFLTGDQIYADDVADALATHIVQVGPELLGREESFTTSTGSKRLADMPPRSRAEIATKECGFTSSHAPSHLFGLGEYYALYLLSWSDTLWPDDLPIPEEVLPDEHATAMQYIDELRPDADFDDVRGWVEEPGVPDDVWHKLHEADRIGDLVEYSDAVEELREFTEARDRVISFEGDLPAVRRALANVPTYMIFDDHDVTDDWYLTGQWCKQVVGSPMGTQVLQNALIAYAVFQGWGNTPRQFEPGSKGRQVLDHVEVEGSGTALAIVRTDLDDLLGIPKVLTSGDDETLEWPSDPIDWHYTVRGTSDGTTTAHEVLVLDTRTQRGFLGDEEPSEILRADAFGPQIPETASTPAVTVVVSAVPVWLVPIAGFGKELLHGNNPAGDPEHWHLQHQAQERLLARLASRPSAGDGATRSRVVFLSGDVHHGFSSRVQYWAEHPFEATASEPAEMVVASLTSSGAKNTDPTTLVNLLNYLGYQAAWIVAVPFLPLVIEGVEESIEWIFGTDLEVPLWAQLPSGLAVYPLVKLLEGMPEEIVFGWNEELPELRHPPGVTERSPPVVRDHGEFGDEYELVPAPQPDWYYRVDFVDAETYADESVDHSAPVDSIPIPRHSATGNQTRAKAFAAYLDHVSGSLFELGGTVYYNQDPGPSDRSGEYGSGSEIVGMNNVGEVAFEWGREGAEGDAEAGAETAPAKRNVVHALWWRLDGDSGALPPFPLSKYVVSLDFDDDDHRRPEVIAGS